MTDFTTKLDAALSEYLGHPGIHTSIRISSDLSARKRLLAESQLPKAGVYWWLPRLDPDVKWQVVGFWHELYGDDAIHAVLWDKFIINELVATLNLPRAIISDLRGLYNALPRGRVIKKQSGEYHIHHGSDVPGNIDQVLAEFSLPISTPIVTSPHEAMDVNNYKKLCKAINIDLGLYVA